MATIVVLGDGGSHPGAVSSASPTSTAMGKLIARVGDTFNCSIDGPNPIISTPQTVATDYGALIAVTGAVCQCGCVLTGSATPDIVV